MADGASSPARGEWSSVDEELAYYKTQYETLEVELQEFQASSKELEAELEKDIEESEKRERRLKEKVEALAFEVEEWKVRCHLPGPRAALPNLLTTTLRRPNTNKARSKPAMRRTRFKKRSLRSANHSGPSRCSCAIPKFRTTTLSARVATKRHR